ncbi:hypothetical protein MnTg02_03200 [bacterium MnTg02]|nr:hypothetical protein MnTg02_03200 [bacterium MnTg02]
MQQWLKCPLLHFFFEDGGGIGLRRPGVDDERQARFARGGNMHAEARRLHIARRIVIMIIEPRFANTHDFGMGGELDKLLRGHIRLFGRIVWMSADRTENILMPFRDCQNSVEFPHARGDGHHELHPRIRRARQHAVEILGQAGEIQMAVAIDKGKGHLCCFQFNYRPRPFLPPHSAGRRAPV